MTAVFADSGYWVAMLSPGDQWHRAARLATDRVIGRRIVTSEMVLVEFLNSVARFGPINRRQAVVTAEGLYDNPSVEVVPQTTAQLRAAAERYASRLDQR